jgi:ABC-type amino acid transport substrate-binding protein/heat shock protein HslJ
MSGQSTNASQQNKTNPWMIVVVICGALAVMLILVLIAVTIAKPAPEPPVVQDDSWPKIQNTGVLRVATAADYPPFAFYNSDFQIDGFDPALIKQVGDQLGLKVQISDYAFEGLASVLHVGQADVAIAAISVTPEREAIVDFTNVYYVGMDGILARTDSSIGQITTPQQMAGMRVGVQDKSVFQRWAQENLVDTGLISQDKLFVYAKPEHAVDDLRQNRLDVVIMDLQPATAALALGDLKLAGQGLNQQRFAIALPQGANTLKAEINQALLTLQNNGTVNELANEYLGLKPEDVIPPPTPEPTLEPCVDAMEFVEDLNYDDEDLSNFPDFDPNQSFQKGWRIRNNGTCTWNNAYFIKYVNGNNAAAQMQGQPTAIQGEVKPGQTYDMYVNLVAPAESGRYVGYWQMFNEKNVAFGRTVWVAIEVIGPELHTSTPTVTPQATATPTEPLPTATITPPPPTATEVPPIPTLTEVPPTPTATEKPGSDLREKTWVLVSYLANIDDEELTEVIPDTQIDLAFDEEDTYAGNAGCNTYSGRYVTDGEKILLTAGPMTRLICEQPPGVMEQETIYINLLQQVEEYRFNEDDQLEFIRFVLDENNQREEKILLVFENNQQAR